MHMADQTHDRPRHWPHAHTLLLGLLLLPGMFSSRGQADAGQTDPPVQSPPSGQAAQSADSANPPQREAKFNAVLKLNAPAPGFGPLPAADGKSYSLQSFRDAKVLVIFFTCNHCPSARQYDHRIREFVEKYQPQGVEMIGLSVSRDANDSLERMRARHAKTPLPYSFLYDESQQTGRQYGAFVTPHFFVLNRARKVVYMGAFDDETNPQKVTRHYLTDAVDACLRGELPRVQESLPRGCEIEFEEAPKGKS